jgi:Malonate decarboxylase gamma subunit (MdcE)
MSADDSKLTPAGVLEALREVVMPRPVELGAGDLEAAEIVTESRRCLALLFDYQRNQGSIGVREAQQLVSAFHRVRHEDLALVLLLDTSGIRVTDAISGIASLRSVLREALDARLEGRSMLAMSINHTFGGASMLASLCQHRFIHAQCIFAMSGPKLIMSASGPNSVAGEDQGEIIKSTCGAARAACSPDFELVAPTAKAFAQTLLAWLNEPRTAAAPVDQLREAGVDLGARLAGVSTPTIETQPQWCASIGPDMDRILRDCFNGEYELEYAEGVPIASSRAIPGSYGFVVEAESGVGARQALALSRALSSIAEKDPKRCLIFLDSDGHSASLADERLILSEYLGHLALTVRMLHRQGQRVELIVAGRGGGGIQAALGSSATSVGMVPQSRLFVLPHFAMGALNKTAFANPGSPAVAISVGAADIVLKTRVEDSEAAKHV